VEGGGGGIGVDVVVAWMVVLLTGGFLSFVLVGGLWMVDGGFGGDWRLGFA
jgi:hypothetical protein